MKSGYITPLEKCHRESRIGRKAHNLLWLQRNGFRVPDTCVCTWDAHRAAAASDPDVRKSLRNSLSGIIDPGQLYAVRSSSAKEDDRTLSHAGLYTSLLNVSGTDNLLQAIESVWDSMHSSRVYAYAERNSLRTSDTYMAVIIQKMVTAQLSGVVFTHNPLTGRKETVVEAVRDSNGSALMQGYRTPLRWIFRHGECVKAPEERSSESGVVAVVARQAAAAHKRYGTAVDMEWAYDGRRLYWLQLRPITALESTDIYTNHFSREFLPGIILPLVWSVNIPVFNGAWKRMLTEVTGDAGLDIHKLAKSFFYRAYFNTGIVGNILKRIGLPPDMIEILLFDTENKRRLTFSLTAQSLLNLPRVMLFVLQKIRLTGRLDLMLPGLKTRFLEVKTGIESTQNAQDVAPYIDTLLKLTQETAYYNLITQISMYLYTYLGRFLLKKLGVDCSIMSAPDNDALTPDCSPSGHLHALYRQFCGLEVSVREKITSCSYEEFCSLKGIDRFQESIDGFLLQFGHLSDSGNDFSHPLWREDPKLILDMITRYDPGKRHAADRAHAVPEIFLKRGIAMPVVRRARRYRALRESVSFLHTFGYSLFRDCFLKLGGFFMREGLILHAEDIFYLSVDEVRAIIGGRTDQCDPKKTIDDRKREIIRCRHTRLPALVCGDMQPPFLPAEGNELSGIGVSQGYYQGKLRIITGLKDFQKVQTGDVIAIPYSDVGLTPLFNKAGAIVAESGGMLSHSSIIAREYRIPAVVSVEGICSLQDDTMVTVNGFEGTIMVHDKDPGS